ncbi:MAG TPA: hypothetical protein VG125_10910 [Pirellulales bacterium]|nr:hypothetical protein [Pirellulales bacterium]
MTASQTTTVTAAAAAVVLASGPVRATGEGGARAQADDERGNGN